MIYDKILVTGTAGFIGFYLVNKLVSTGVEVVGIDNINDHYDPELKLARLNEVGICRNKIKWYFPVQSDKYPNYRIIRMNLEDERRLHELFEYEEFDCVVNLAAQACVRYSIENPSVYIQANIVGSGNVLESCIKTKVKHLVYASSSSVYGMNEKMPFSTKDSIDHPISIYAATKKANELMAHTYSHLYNLPTTSLRFFTVYWQWGRPDMAYFLFAKAIIKYEPIKV